MPGTDTWKPGWPQRRLQTVHNMHVLFVHKNFPAQFGHIAARLVRDHGYKCTYVSEKPAGRSSGVTRLQYTPRGGATAQTHYFARTFENAVAHSHGVYEALKPYKKRLHPDLIVGHSGFGSTLFLPDLFPGVPLINFFEYYYRAQHADADFRPDFQMSTQDRLRVRTRNAMILLDLQQCAAGYTPTHFQKQRFPKQYHPKIEVIFDGVPTDFWYRRPVETLKVGTLEIGPDQRVVTYVSRGKEAMRGFDLFMKIAKRLTDTDPNVVVLVVGSDRVCYGGDLKYIQEKSFKDHVLKQDTYNLDRIRMLGRLAPEVLVQLLSRSDLHIYLTVPFVLSWSVLDAMACGCTLLCSDTAPVREVIRHNVNGLLCDFFDVDGFVAQAQAVLADPEGHRKRLGRQAVDTVAQTYSLDVTLPQMVRLYETVVNRGTPD